MLDPQASDTPTKGLNHMALPVHPLSTAAADSRSAPATAKERRDVKPMGGSRRKKIYKTQGGKDMTPAQTGRYAAKVSRNGYIPKSR